MLAESVKPRAAERAPDADGLKVTLTVQLAEAARLVPHVFEEMAKSAEFAPVTATLLMEIVPLLTFLSVTDCAAVVDPTLVDANDKLAGLTLAPVVPVPDSATVCGLGAALSLKSRVAVRIPVVVGANTILAVQLAEAARLVPQVLEAIRKSPAFAPVITTLLMLTVVDPLLLSVTTFWPPLFPTGTYTQFRLVGEAETAPSALTPGTKHRRGNQHETRLFRVRAFSANRRRPMQACAAVSAESEP